MQRYILALLMTMVVLSPMAIDIYLASVVQMAAELQASNSQIQSTISLFFLAMGLGQVVVGPLADRYGRKPVAIFGLALYLFSSFAASMVGDIWLMQLVRLLQGFAACAISVIIFSIVRDTYSYERSSKVYSYLNGVLSVIPALAPIFGSALAESFGWRSTFVFMGSYALLVLCLVARFLPETLKASANTSTARLYNWQQSRPVLSSRYFIFYALCCMTALAGILSYVSYAPIWLMQHLGVSATTFSLLFGLNAFASIVCSFVAPLLITRFGNRKMVVAALCLMLLAAVLLIVFQLIAIDDTLLQALVFMLPVMFLSMGLSLILGPATSMALAGFAERAGTASALLGFIQMVGASVVIVSIQQSDLVAPVAGAVVLLSLAIPLLLMMLLPRFSDWNAEVPG